MRMRNAIRERRFGATDYAFAFTLCVAGALLVAGLALPAFTNDRLARGAESLSIIGGALQLGVEGSPGFMLVIILFSAVFPVAKLAAMLTVWLFRFDVNTEERTMHWLEILGKWSMLDVFVIATTIGAAHLKLLNRTTTEAGIYVFGLAILLSMLASIILRRRLQARIELVMASIGPGERLFGIAVGATSLALFFGGLLLPLFSIEKWLFWNKDYSLLTALPQMIAEREFLLPSAIAVFVIVLPLCRFVSLTATRLRRRPPRRLVSLAFGFDKWTMWEVYALALVIVGVKLADFTSLEFRTGFWLIMAVVPLSLLDGWLFRRRLELSETRTPAD